MKKLKRTLTTIVLATLLMVVSNIKAIVPKVVEVLHIDLPATQISHTVSLDDIPEYSGSPSIEIDNGIPSFSTVSSEYYTTYGDLDLFGRCTKVVALVGPETLATEERESIGMFKPAGWQTVRYDDLIEDKYLYNRCHLLMFALAGNETNNEKNLVTGTRYLNIEGMLPYETEILNYIRNSGQRVEYHITPIFKGIEALPRGIHMEALSEDGGLKINAYAYNVQPGIEIDYLTGNSKRSEN